MPVKDMFLSLLAFCQSQLKPHLQPAAWRWRQGWILAAQLSGRFSVMLGFFGPIASLVPHLGPQAKDGGDGGSLEKTQGVLAPVEAPGILLPVRLCVVIRP